MAVVLDTDSYGGEGYFANDLVVLLSLSTAGL